MNKPYRDSPSHGGWYTAANGKFDAIDVIQQFKLGYEKGNAIEYIIRGGKKPGEPEKKDLEKAIFYLEERIRQVDRDTTDLDNRKPSARDYGEGG